MPHVEKRIAIPVSITVLIFTLLVLSSSRDFSCEHIEQNLFRDDSIIESCQTEHAENLYVLEYGEGAIVCEVVPNRCVSLKRPKQ